MRPNIRWTLPMLCLLCAAQTRPATSTAPGTTPAKVDLYALTTEQFFKRPELQDRITKDSVNIPLLETAIFHQTNRERANLKLPLFKHSWAMNLMARRHSTEMETLQFFDHVSPTPANRTLTERLKNVGLVNVTAGENIAVLPAREVGSGNYIIHKNADGTDRWTDEATGKEILYYSYAELAEAVVTDWMNSPAHHANIVDKRFVYLGVGAARGSYDKGQDSLYMTQNFTATINGGEGKALAELQPAATNPAKPTPP